MKGKTYNQEYYLGRLALWRRQWHPTPILLPGKSHGRRSLVGCSPWGHWGSDNWATSLSLFTFHLHALEKEMATHSSVLAQRIPGTGEPGGLPSMGLHRVGHDWSNLAAAATGSHSDSTEKSKAKRIQHYQTSFTTNSKGISLGEWEGGKATTRNKITSGKVISKEKHTVRVGNYPYTKMIKPKTRRREYKHQKWELHFKLRDRQLNLQADWISNSSCNSIF